MRTTNVKKPVQKDSKSKPEKHNFESGASSSGYKIGYEMLTFTFLKRCTQRMELGKHYGKHNWKKGVEDKQFILDRLNHAFEHLVKVMFEIDNGITMSDDDLAAVCVNCMFAMEYQEVNQLDVPSIAILHEYSRQFESGPENEEGPSDS